MKGGVKFGYEGNGDTRLTGLVQGAVDSCFITRCLFAQHKYGLLSERGRYLLTCLKDLRSLEAFPSSSLSSPPSSSTCCSMSHFLTSPEMIDTHSSESASA